MNGLTIGEVLVLMDTLEFALDNLKGVRDDYNPDSDVYFYYDKKVEETIRIIDKLKDTVI